VNYQDYSRAVLIDLPWLEFNLPRHGRVLDAGCGTGWAIRSLEGKGLRTIGLDLQRTTSNSVHGTVASLPFRSQSFDVVVCVRTLHHVEEEPRVLREFARVLRPTGFLLVSVANRWSYTLLQLRVGSSRWMPNPAQPRYRLYSSTELVHLLEAEGFVVIGIRTCHFVPQWLGRNPDGTYLPFFVKADPSLGLNPITARFGPLWVACGRKQ